MKKLTKTTANGENMFRGFAGLIKWGVAVSHTAPHTMEIINHITKGEKICLG
ncbi:hypothetical protein ACFL0Q_08090 [Thermodesulfobacteriota bacterium]